MTDLRTVGVWATRSALADPQGTARELKSSRVNLCSIMLNSIPSSSSFSVLDSSKVIALASACHAAGIEVTLTSWIRPYYDYIKQAATQLKPLMESTGATLLVWDAEEPWTQAQAPRMSWSGAAQLVGELFPDTPMGLTGIGAVSAEKLGPLAKICGVWQPQAYATTREGSADPERVVDYCLAQWRKHLGEPSIGWCIGLAAYSQSSSSGLEMQASVDSVLGAGIDSVCYWSANAIERDPGVKAFVSGLRTVSPALTGVMPELILNKLKHGVAGWALLRVQGLLSSHGFDPGPLDGMIGPQTRRALASFQEVRGGPAERVDGNTWLSLLGP